MSTGTYSLVKTVVTGETITASDRNAEHTNHITNAEPDGIGSHSDNLTEMRTTTDPYPASTPSLATDLAGEIERLRYVVQAISGGTYWYLDPPSRCKVGTLTRNVGSGSANVAYTGVGFQPSAVVFLAAIGTAVSWSVGFDDASVAACITSVAQTTADRVDPITGSSIYIHQTAGVHTGAISAMGADGFTISWAGSGSPSGTATVYYLALR